MKSPETLGLGVQQVRGRSETGSREGDRLGPGTRQEPYRDGPGREGTRDALRGRGRGAPALAGSQQEICIAQLLPSR